MSETVLCLDIGTTSLKAGLITADGEVVSFCSIPFENPQDPFVASSWLRCFAKALTLLDRNSTAQTTIQALAISGNGPTVVADSGLTVLWNDISYSEPLPAAARFSLFMPKILTMKKDYSAEFKSTSHIFSGPEYLIYLLTGNAVTILPEKRFVSAYWTEESCKACKVPFEKMPAYVETGAVCGEIPASLSADLLPDFTFENLTFAPACKVIAGGPDFVVALIGTNTLEPGKLCDRCGSSEGFNFCVDKQIFKPGVRTLPSVIPGLWNVSVLIPDSGAMAEKERLEKIHVAIETLRKLAAENNIVFPSEMSVTGGQSNDVLLLQEKAEILNMKILHASVNGVGFAHSELLGDACAAYYGLGKYKSLQEAAAHIVKQKA